MTSKAKPMFLKAQAISLSVLVDLDSQPKAGYIHSAFRNTVNILCTDMTWISLHPPGTYMHPYAVRIRVAQTDSLEPAAGPHNRFTFLGVRPGQAVAASRSKIEIMAPGGMPEKVIGIGAADPWNPYLRTGHSCNRDDHAVMLHTVTRLLADVLHDPCGFPSEAGLDKMHAASPFMAVVLGLPLGVRHRGDYMWDRIVRAQADRAVLETETGLRLQSSDHLLSGMRRAVGLGLGVTPSGDDFLTGMIGAYFFFAYDDDFRQKLFVSARSVIDGTTLPAFFMLKAALRGLCPEPLGVLLHALSNFDTSRRLSPNGHTVHGDLAGLKSAIEGLTACGATSGEDMLAGVMSWLRASADCECAYAAN